MRVSPSPLTEVTRCVIGSWSPRSTVTMSPTLDLGRGDLVHDRERPVGIVGSIEPVLNMISVTWNSTAAITTMMQISPPIARDPEQDVADHPRRAAAGAGRARGRGRHGQLEVPVKVQVMAGVEVVPM